MSGDRLGHYALLEKLGAGGMGEVYRAEDSNLHRQVAIKIVPDEFAHDAERLARFQREAQVLASLNHPNIATLYGLEESDGKRFIAMELVEGETLAQRLVRGPLPADEALQVCRQIAEGLEAAHEKGIIHRDLKPGNVMVTADDKVKILDFGLAKATAAESAAASATHSPTITQAMTQAGTILGTAAYMSPEQAKGKAVDKRADIWAFGCILYECLTGKVPFRGDTVTETMAKILEGTLDWDRLPAATPPQVKELLQRCLRKDARERLHDIADARIEIEESLRNLSIPGRAQPTESKRIGWLPVAGAVLTAVVVTALVTGVLSWNLKPRSSLPVVRFNLGVEPAKQFGAKSPGRPSRTALAWSADGSALVYVGVGEDRSQLYLRTMDRWEAVPIPGTEGGRHPFLSPDGRWVGFWADGKLKKASIDGNLVRNP